MFWYDYFGKGYAVWYGPEMVDFFSTEEECQAFIEEMNK